MGNAAGQLAHGFHFLSLAKLSVEFALAGHVPLQPDVIHHRAVAVPHGADDRVGRVERPVLATVAYPSRPALTTLQGGPEIAVELGPLQAAPEDPGVLADRLGGGVAGHPLKGRVDVDDGSVEFGDQHQFGGLLHHLAETGDAVLCLLALRHVPGDPLERHHPPLGIAHQHVALLHPGGAAVLAHPGQQQGLPLQFLRPVPQGLDQVVVLRGQELQGQVGVGIELLGGVPRNGRRSRADIFETAFRLHPVSEDDVGGVLAQPAEARFALTELRFHLSSLGQVAADADIPGHRAALRHDRGAPGFDVHRPAIPAVQGELTTILAVAVQHRLHLVQGVPHRLHAQPLIGIRAQHFRLGPAVELLRRVVPVGHPMLEVIGNDRIAQAADDRALELQGPCRSDLIGDVRLDRTQRPPDSNCPADGQRCCPQPHQHCQPDRLVFQAQGSMPEGHHEGKDTKSQPQGRDDHGRAGTHQVVECGHGHRGDRV